MTRWLVAAALLVAALVPSALLALRGRAPDRLVGFELGAATATLALVAVAEALRVAAFLDLALTLALLSFGGGIVFARFLERWS